MSDILNAALEYASSGRPVFPVNRDKEPYTQHGFKNASTDESVIREWWASHPDAGIATPTGDGFFVIDVDNEEALSALEAEHGRLPPTWEVVTPRPGRHLYFRGDATTSSGLLPDDIHCRGTGGYVLLPPSPHKNGGVYEWRTATDEVDCAPAPSWLLELLKPSGQNGNAPRVEGDIPELQRNTTLTSMAGTMRRRGFSERAMAAALLVENADRCKPPLKDSEVRKIAHSIARHKPSDDAVATFDDLSSGLGLSAINKRVDMVRMFGRGSNAIAHIFLDNDERIVLDPVGKFTTAPKLNAELALQAGAKPKLKEVSDVLVSLYKLADHLETVNAEDRAADLGAEYLTHAVLGEVDMSDQESRWKAFHVLERALCSHETVLEDSKTGIRYVRIGWFAEYVRNRGAVADTVLRSMTAVGWEKRGAEGQIKATSSLGTTKRLRFFEVPKGWGE